MSDATIPAVSTEYLHVPVTSSVELDEQTVEIAVVKEKDQLDESTAWYEATWTGDPDKERTCRLLVGPASEESDTQLNRGTYTVWVRVHDAPEVPVRKAGAIRVT